MDGADAGAGEHGDGGFGDHGEVDGYAVAAVYAQRFHGVGQAADLVVQLAVGDVAAVVGVVALPDDGGLVGAGWEMGVQADGGRVEGAVLEPFYVHIAFEAGVAA